ncbi:hypothetical protein LN650_10875 [Klebsiella pneumoniae subsp. pneumoniae]|nr:hypothetical protein [Klebsiella pneumoniae subsp. pneumoniae]
MVNLTSAIIRIFLFVFFDVNAFTEVNGVCTPERILAHQRMPVFFIPQLFRRYDKVVFIDSDTVVKADLGELA